MLDTLSNTPESTQKQMYRENTSWGQPATSPALIQKIWWACRTSLGLPRACNLITKTLIMSTLTTRPMATEKEKTRTTRSNHTFPDKFLAGAVSPTTEAPVALTMIYSMLKTAQTLQANSEELGTKWEWAIIALEETLSTWVTTNYRSKVENSTTSLWADGRRNSTAAQQTPITCKAVNKKTVKIIIICNKISLRLTS